MQTFLYRAAATWTAVGLALGLFYREFTKANDFTGYAQLAVTHTHALTLGTIVMLVLLALAVALPLANRQFRWGLVVWQVSLVLTVGMQAVKGCLQVLGNDAADSPAIAGVSGLGHIGLTVAFVLIFLGIRKALPQAAERTAA